MVQQGAGKRSGARRAPKKKARLNPAILLLSVAVTVLVVAWGYLVKAAIDFGTDARDGESAAWLFLLLACVGAAGCLFLGLVLVSKLLAAIGILPETATGPPVQAAQPAQAAQPVHVTAPMSAVQAPAVQAPAVQAPQAFAPAPAASAPAGGLSGLATPRTPHNFAPPREHERQQHEREQHERAPHDREQHERAQARGADHPTGSHAAIIDESAEPRLPNPRYPGGKRAAR